MFYYEENSLLKEAFESELNLINDKSVEKLVNLFRFILYSVCMSECRILYYSNGSSSYPDPVKHLQFVIEDRIINEIRDKLIVLQNFISEMDLDVCLRLNQKFSNYSVEIFFYADTPEKSRLVIDNYTYSLRCEKSFRDKSCSYSTIYKKSHKMFMYKDLQPYMECNKRCFPMSIKYLFGIFDNLSFDMLRVILLWYSHYWIVFKDILTDYQNGCTTMPPFSFADIMAAHNRRELLEIKLKKI